ncbi:MAG TPA: sensor histidine kinase [bacterium]|nr:sensor histidine kinase [bacterium]
MDSVRRSFNYLFADLIERVLSLAGDPGSCAKFTAESLRSIIGARTVLVIECSNRTPDHEHEAVSVFPERRKSLGQEEAIQRIAAQSHGLSSARIFTPCAEGPIPQALRELESGPTIVSPLISGPERIGVLILLDLMDSQNVETILDTLNDLSTVLSLVLRNAFLYQNLEQEVRKRTRELEDKNLVLAKTLRERELMLKEIHHRVKNNLQIINSLLYLQASTSNDQRVQEALEKGQNRIHSMALVHEELYHSEDLERIDILGYTKKLCQNLESIEYGERITIRIEGTEPGLLLPITYSVSIGIILNELITNALKHAYPQGTGGSIIVRIENTGQNATITVADDGPGIAEDLDIAQGRTLGLSLVHNLAQQIHGSFRIQNRSELEAGRQGSIATLAFPLGDDA